MIDRWSTMSYTGFSVHGREVWESGDVTVGDEGFRDSGE